jgi:transposase-like protein
LQRVGQEIEVHPVMIRKWKQEFIEHSTAVFEKKKKEATKSMSISPWQDQRARDEDGLLKNLRNRK